MRRKEHMWRNPVWALPIPLGICGADEFGHVREEGCETWPSYDWTGGSDVMLFKNVRRGMTKFKLVNPGAMCGEEGEEAGGGVTEVR